MSKLKKVRSGNFTQISNIIFDDSRLSYKEIGLYCNMMKFPDDWEFSIRYLADLHQDKKAAVTTGIEKLIELGYIVRTGKQFRNKQGMFGTYDYVIYEDPMDNPNFVPHTSVKGKRTVSDFQTTVDADGKDTVSDNRITGKNAVTPVSDNRITDDPITDFRSSDNQTVTNTINTNTVFTNTFLPKVDEEDDIARVSVDLDVFKRKLMNGYMNEYLSTESEKEMLEVDQAFNAMINAAKEITDPEIINAVNAFSADDMSSLFVWVYRNLFSTKIGCVVNKVTDKTAYLKKVISSQAKSCYGPNPFRAFGEQTR